MFMLKLTARFSENPVLDALAVGPYTKYAARAAVNVAPKASIRKPIHLFRAHETLAVRT